MVARAHTYKHKLQASVFDTLPPTTSIIGYDNICHVIIGYATTGRAISGYAIRLRCCWFCFCWCSNSSKFVIAQTTQITSSRISLITTHDAYTETNKTKNRSNWDRTTIWNKNDCWRSKTRSKHITDLQDRCLWGRNTTCEFSGQSPLSSYRTTPKQQLIGENRWKMRWRTEPLICCWLSSVVFVTSCFHRLTVI